MASRAGAFAKPLTVVAILDKVIRSGSRWREEPAGGIWSPSLGLIQ